MSIKAKEEKNYEQDLLDAQAQATDNLAGWQKALADYQNLQKEQEKKLANLKTFLSLDIIGQLLPIFDNYQLALSHIPEAEKKLAWAIGLEHVFKLWEAFLRDQGVKEISALGQKFDPEYHESIGQIQNKDLADQEIVEVKLIGYSYQDQILRPSKVIINNLI